MAEGGFRGYIGCRPIGGHRVPQHVQNLVIRDYAQRRGLAYRLSAAEYVMPGCYLMLEQALGELEPGGGLIAYSLFMLPSSAEHRRRVWRRILEGGASFHAAVEEQVLEDESDLERLETLFQVHAALPRAWRP
ncbi:MAG: LIC12192 family sporadic carbohydrate cluster protein [Acidobacteriota bacterium]